MAKKRQKTEDADGISVSSLVARISASKANWTAGETSLTRLSTESRVAHLGLRVSDDELATTAQLVAAANKLRALQAFAAPPAAVDWRSNNGNFITSIKDQASCGSCVAFGTIATIESRVNIACKTPGGVRDYSEAFLFYCGCGNCCGTGWNFVPALDFCKNTGVAIDADFPYSPGNQPCKSGVTPTFKINGHASASSTIERKTAIAERGPMVAGMAVFDDFFAYQGGVYRHVSGDLAGYHAISVIGYNDSQGCWICKNSWGTNWGESGFFRIAYGESIDTQFTFYEPHVSCPSPVPVDNCSQYVPHLQQVLEVARQNAALRACLRYYVCRRGLLRPRCSGSIMEVVRTVNAILDRCPQYRQSFCRLLG